MPDSISGAQLVIILIIYRPQQMFPVAVVCGNTYVFKPSERVPGATMLLVKLLQEAGCPDGVVNVIHGQHDAVNFVCDHPSVRAVSFVGSDQAVSGGRGGRSVLFEV